MNAGRFVEGLYPRTLAFKAQCGQDIFERPLIQVVDGRDLLVALRLDGAGIESFEQTWKSGDIVKIGK